MLIEHHAALRHAHVGLVALSGTWFALRVAGQLAGARWPLGLPARRLSWVIDTALLTAGALLWVALQINPWVQPWLGVKLLLLVVYVGLGTMALRRARTPATRWGWALAALGCLGFMVSVALTRDPAGALRLLG